MPINKRTPNKPSKKIEPFKYAVEETPSLKSYQPPQGLTEALRQNLSTMNEGIERVENIMRRASKHDNGSKRPQGNSVLLSKIDQDYKKILLDHNHVLSEALHPITRICITGGPCAGKTTALANLTTIL